MVMPTLTEETYRSTNFSQSWNRLNSLSLFQIASMMDTCYIISSSNIHHSYDEGLTWNCSQSFRYGRYKTHLLAPGPNGEIYATASYLMISAYSGV